MTEFRQDGNVSEQYQNAVNTDGRPASDFASFIRAQTKLNYHLDAFSRNSPLDKGNVIGTNKMYNFDKMSKEEIAVVLAKHVRTIQSGIILMNKPNGISVEDRSFQTVSILDVLPFLEKELKLKESIHIVHRLDKDTTGVLLLAANPEVAFLLKDSFKRGIIRKNYLCLTHGVPHMKEGIIDFPLKEVETDDHFMIKPDMKYILKREKNDDGDTSSMCTAFKVLASNYNIALVQCAAITGKKHQIRAHLAYGLHTPILGDHKYAWFLQSQKLPIMPQELSRPALAGLRLTAGKVRNVPLHLHAHQLIIGEVPTKPKKLDPSAPLQKVNLNKPQNPLQNDKFYANLPSFFLKNLTKLGLNSRTIIKSALNFVL